MRKIFCLFIGGLGCMATHAQIDGSNDSIARYNQVIDSLYIEEMESLGQDGKKKKLLHAEPLYIDLIRDLGARKGEREWNLGTGITDNSVYDKYEALIEYEWAPMDRLGLEVELPFSFYYPTANQGATPSSRLNSLKMASQFTFLVSEQWNTSMAIGYLHEFELAPFNEYGRNPLFTGNIFNPFYVAAKRWGQNLHTLIYTGPVIQKMLGSDRSLYTYEIHSSFHYMIAGTRNFIGVEVNKSITANDFDMTIRPQMRVVVADNFMVGIVSGIPVQRETQRFSSFIRLIYEPGHNHVHR